MTSFYIVKSTLSDLNNFILFNPYNNLALNNLDNNSIGSYLYRVRPAYPPPLSYNFYLYRKIYRDIDSSDSRSSNFTASYKLVEANKKVDKEEDEYKEDKEEVD